MARTNPSKPLALGKPLFGFTASEQLIVFEQWQIHLEPIQSALRQCFDTDGVLDIESAKFHLIFGLDPIHLVPRLTIV